MNKCQNCGAVNRDDSIYCISCGIKLTNVQQQYPQYSENTDAQPNTVQYTQNGDANQTAQASAPACGSSHDTSDAVNLAPATDSQATAPAGNEAAQNENSANNADSGQTFTADQTAENGTNVVDSSDDSQHESEFSQNTQSAFPDGSANASTVETPPNTNAGAPTDPAANASFANPVYQTPTNPNTYNPPAPPTGYYGGQQQYPPYSTYYNQQGYQGYQGYQGSLYQQPYQPYGQQPVPPVQQNMPRPPYYAPYYPTLRPSSGGLTAWGVINICLVIFSSISFFGGIFSMIFGIIALVQQSKAKMEPDDFRYSQIMKNVKILNAIGTILFAVGFIIFIIFVYYIELIGRDISYFLNY